VFERLSSDKSGKERGYIGINVLIDGEVMGKVDVLLGPLNEVIEYRDVTMTLAEVRQAWKMNR
jgi:hypothetical protein